MSDDRSYPEPSRGPAEDVETFDKLVAGERTCMFNTITVDGNIHSRPMAVQAREGNVVWFFAFADSGKINQIEAHNNVNLTFSDGDTWVSASGTACAVDDVVKKQELWNKFAQAWFQCEPTDPTVALIKVELTGGEFWDSASKPAQLVSFAKTLLTGERPDDGENRKLDLG